MNAGSFREFTAESRGPMCGGVSQWMQDPTSSSPRPGSLMPGKEEGGQKLGFYEHEGSHSWDISPELHLEEEKKTEGKKSKPHHPSPGCCTIIYKLKSEKRGQNSLFFLVLLGFFFYPQHYHSKEMPLGCKSIPATSRKIRLFLRLQIPWQRGDTWGLIAHRDATALTQSR